MKECLNTGIRVALLVVAESSGSSPGRAGYKMAVAADGRISGSIGGGLMEVNLVESARQLFSAPQLSASRMIEQEHRRGSVNASGMICSGRQTVIIREVTPDDRKAVDLVLSDLANDRDCFLRISETGIHAGPAVGGATCLERRPDGTFTYSERIKSRDRIYIVGGGHCSLALSEVIARLGFSIHIYDDRAELNTIEKNRFADEIILVEGYDQVADRIPEGSHDAYVVVMTLGYASDLTVVRALLGRDFRYFGVLGSRAKIATLMRELRADGHGEELLRQLHAPVGLDIKSQTPEEIAISIAAEMISIRNQTNLDTAG